MNINLVNYNALNRTNIVNKSQNIETKEDQELLEVCQDFESIFLYMMLKEMKKSVPKDGLIERSSAIDTFEDMYLDELSKEVSSGDNSIGLAQELYEQLRGSNAYRSVKTPKIEG